MRKNYLLYFLFVLLKGYSLVAATPTARTVAKVTSSNVMPPTATISGTTTVCQNEAGVVITFTGIGGTSPYTFTYTVDSGSPQTVQTSVGSDTVTIAVNTTASGVFQYNLVSVQDASTPITTPVVVIPQTGSAIVTVKPQPIISLGGTGSGTVFNGLPAFRTCSSTTNSSFSFTNTSTNTSLDTKYTIDWGDGSPNFTATTWSTTTHSYGIGYWELNYTIESSNNCPVTQKYVVYVGANPAVSLGNPGNTDVCNPDQLTFPITGTSSNPPGTTYTITFNDGSAPITYSHPAPPSITHTFLKSSCGITSSDGTNSYPNSFKANIVAQNPCGSSAVSVVPIYVSTPPVPDFTMASTGCTNTSICLTNATTGAFENNGSSNACDVSPRFVWAISPAVGYTVASGTVGNDFGSTDPNLWISGTSPLCIRFTQAGTYTVTIKTANKCGGFVTKQRQICIEGPLAPAFTLSNTVGCSPLAISATNTTVETNTCTTATYLWTTTYAAANCGSGTLSIPNQTTKNASFNFSRAGTYTIRLTASNSCAGVSTTQTVEVKQPPTATITAIANLCGPGIISPTATVNSCTSSVLPLTYAWSFPGGSPATANTAIPGAIRYSTAGNYTASLVVTNDCGNAATTSQNFSVLESPTITNTDVSQTICSGTASAAINLTSDIVGTTFSWSATASSGVSGFVATGTSATIPSRTFTTTNATAGTVTYIVTPQNGSCAGTPFTFLITVTPAPVISQQPISSTVCLNGSPTQLAVALSTTSATPTYQWFSNSNNSFIGGVALVGAQSSTFDPPSNSVGTVYYYCVITLASGGCTTLTSTIATVTVSPSLSIATQPLLTQSLCSGYALSTPLSVVTSGGFGTNTYQWFSNTTASNTGGTLLTGANASTYTPPVYGGAGTFYYYVTSTRSANGCGSVTSNSAEVIVYDQPIITSQPIASQVLCSGDIPAVLTVQASGGSGSFSYQWYRNTTNNTTTGVLITGATSASYQPTASTGTTYYYCKVSQAATLGCVATSNTALVQFAVSPVVTRQPVSSTICLAGSVTTLNFTIANGVGAPNYQWYSNASPSVVGGIAILGATNATYSPPNTIVGVTYYYCVISFPGLSGGCSDIVTAVTAVTINPNPQIGNIATTTCSGTRFTATPSSGGSDIVPVGTTYTWTTPTVSPLGSVTGAAAQTVPQTSISQLLTNTTTASGTVTYNVRPTSGSCIGAVFTVVVTVNPAINVTETVVDNACFGVNAASISVNARGGIPFATGTPFLYSWTGPSGFTATTAAISNLLPGDYNLTITDAGSCPFTKLYSISAPTAIAIGLQTQQDVSCFGGNDGLLAVAISGGSGSYSYAWTKNGLPFSTLKDLTGISTGNYQVVVTDSKNCTAQSILYSILEPSILTVGLQSKVDILCYGASTGAITITVSGGSPTLAGYTFSWSGPNGFRASSQNLINVAAGRYTATVTDSKNCFKNLVVDLSQKTQIVISSSFTPILCYGDENGTISASISGGTAPYTYQWSNLATTLNQTNLGAGDYVLTVVDANNCEVSKTISIPQVPVFTVNPVKKNISCFGAKDGSIALNLVGGIAPVTLVWSDGSTAGLTRNNLAAGRYTATISDGTPCQIQRSFVILEPQELVVGSTITNALDCANAASGAIQLLISGGTAPFTYLWSNGATTKDLIAISAGTYEVEVKDANGCVKEAQFSVYRPLPLLASVTVKTDVDCDTSTINQIYTAVISGGVPPYTLNWSSGTVSGTSNETMTTNQNGSVILTATDRLGCQVDHVFDVEVPIASVTAFATNSFAQTTFGSYSIEDPIQFTNTATGNYDSITWDFGDNTFSNEANPIHIYKTEGAYVVTQNISYPFGCVYSNSLRIIVDKGYKLLSPNGFSPNNDGINDYFTPVFVGLNTIEFTVYDTWGSVIYTEKGDNIRGWDGKIKDSLAENGNYYFKIIGKTFYGRTVKDQGAIALLK